MAHLWTSVEGCTTSFDWASNKFSNAWVKLFLEKLKFVTRKGRTHADTMPVSPLTTISTLLTTKWDLFLFKLHNSKWSTLKSDQRITSFHQNQFVTYLISNLLPNFFTLLKSPRIIFIITIKEKWFKSVSSLKWRE